MLPDGFDAFWALWTPIWFHGHPLNPSSLLGVVWGLTRLGGGLGWKITQKKGFGMCLGILWGCINDVSGWF